MSISVQIITVFLILAIPYSYLIARITSYAFFQEKMNYQQSLFNKLSGVNE